MAVFKVASLLIAVAVLTFTEAKPSHHLALQAIPDHFDFTPPVLPPVPFHPEHGHAHIVPPAPFYSEAPGAVLHADPLSVPHLHAAAPHLHFAPAPVLPAPAPLLPAPAPLLPAPAPYLPAPAPVTIWEAPAPSPVLPAPAPVWPAPAPVVHAFAAPVVPAPAPILPAPLPVTKVLPPVYEAIPFAPSYRAIPGPKTTTHHVSVGYAFPAAPITKIVAPVAHTHLRVAPFGLPHHHHHHHHALF